MKDEIKSTVLRPLADKFIDITEKAMNGEYRPSTVEQANADTERYIEQAWQKLENHLDKIRIETADHLHRHQGVDLPKRDYDNDTDEYICQYYIPSLEGDTESANMIKHDFSRQVETILNFFASELGVNLTVEQAEKLKGKL